MPEPKRLWILSISWRPARAKLETPWLVIKLDSNWISHSQNCFTFNRRFERVVITTKQNSNESIGTMFQAWRVIEHRLNRQVRLSAKSQLEFTTTSYLVPAPPMSATTQCGSTALPWLHRSSWRLAEQARLIRRTRHSFSQSILVFDTDTKIAKSWWLIKPLWSKHAPETQRAACSTCGPFHLNWFTGDRIGTNCWLG